MVTLEQCLREWTLGEAYIQDNIDTYAGLLDVVKTQTITWPDGSSGVFTTAGYFSYNYKRVPYGFSITHEVSGFIVIQPTISVTADGGLISEPSLFVGLPIFGFGATPFGAQPFGA